MAADQVADWYKERAAMWNTMTLGLVRWWRSTLPPPAHGDNAR